MADDIPGAPSSPTDPPAPHRRRRRVVIATALVVVLGSVAWRLLRTNEPAKRPAMGPVSVVAATATQSDLDVHLEAIGTVTPVATVSVISQVTGRVIAVRYREGQTVHAGDVLVEIDPRSFEAQLMQAEGTLERDIQVLAQAKMDLERYREAWAHKAIAKQQLDDQEKLVLQTEGTVKLDRGVVDFNRVQLGYCRITAPTTGRIGLRLIDPGNVVTAGTGTSTPLAVITQLQPITVVFSLSEDSLGQVWAQVREGKRLLVDVYDRDSKNLVANGTLLTLDNQIDTTTGTVRLRAQFDNASDELFPNQFVNTRLLIKSLHGVTVVPSSAIQRNGEITFVYVLRDGRAHVQRVTAGVTERDVRQVEGIAPGTLVANSSFEKLAEGVPIVIAPAPEPPSPPVSKRP